MQTEQSRQEFRKIPTANLPVKTYRESTITFKYHEKWMHEQSIQSVDILHEWESASDW